MRGSSTAYIATLAIVLVVAAGVAYLLGSTGQAQQVVLKKSKAYWEKKSPLTFLEWAFYTDGSAVLVVKNKGLSDVRLEELYLDGVNVLSSPANITAGKAKLIYLLPGTLGRCSKGELVIHNNPMFGYRDLRTGLLMYEASEGDLAAVCAPATAPQQCVIPPGNGKQREPPQPEGGEPINTIRIPVVK